MRYRIDLSDCWAKVDHAKMHIDALRVSILREVGNEPHTISLVKQFEPEKRGSNSGALVYRIERTVQIGDDWGLIAGDAIHDLRSALDYLAWQLALRHHEGSVPPTEATRIQFPIHTDKGAWRKHWHWKNMSLRDAIKLRKFQPFSRGRRKKVNITPRGAFIPPGFRILHPLGEIAEFSNADKHRTLQLASAFSNSFSLKPPSSWTDCLPIFAANQHNVQIIARPPSNPPQAGDEIFRIPIIATGPNPDMNFEANLTGNITMREWPALESLNSFVRVVEIILDDFKVA